jgi:hypothetical protein
MSIWVNDVEIIPTGKWVKFGNIAAECYGLMNDPKPIIQSVRDYGARTGNCFDIVTFGQRLPDIEPRHDYYLEWEEIAAIRITTYDDWFHKQIIKETRKNVSKAAKRGIVVRLADYTDELVAGIKEIYDESPIRQGKRFSHFNKDFETVKKENGTYLAQSIYICAFYENRLVGFVKAFLSEGCANTLQVISKIEHRDKKVTNALLAKTVEVCAEKQIPYLQYGVWSAGGLGQFKESNGFTKISIPKYFVPLTPKGQAILKCKLHNGLLPYLPDKAINALKNLRRNWYERRLSR